MYPRIQRALALACTTAALAAAPATAVAMPATDPVSVPEAPAPAIEPRGGDQTLTFVLAGVGALVAVAGAGYVGRTGNRVGQPS
jgi:hypothetical protein